MKLVPYILTLLILGIVACTKDKTPLPLEPELPEKWEKFIGKYNVYDTTGTYLYEIEIINHYDYYHDDGMYYWDIDSLTIINFADTANLPFQYQNQMDERVLPYGFHENVKGHNGQTWQFYTNLDDTNTVVRENTLINDTIIFWFRQTNIQHWINEGVPYFYCDCKHIAVKK